MDRDLPEPDVEIDAIGLLCPLPVLRARKRLMQMAPGEVLAISASDQMAVVDMPHFCAGAGHEFLGTDERDGHRMFYIRRGAGTAED